MNADLVKLALMIVAMLFLVSSMGFAALTVLGPRPELIAGAWEPPPPARAVLHMDDFSAPTSVSWMGMRITLPHNVALERALAAQAASEELE